MQPLLAPPREGLTEAEVAATLRLDHAPKVRHGVDVLDTSDNPTGESLPVDVDSGGEVVWSYRPPDQVTGNTTDASAVRRQATLTLAGEVTVPLIARRFRVWTELLSPSATWVRFHLGVFATTLPNIVDDGLVVHRTLQLADKSYRWARRLLTDSVTVDATTNVVQWVIDRLADTFGETAFSITSSTVTLAEQKTWLADGTTSWLDVFNGMLQTAAFDQLTADENGRPSSVPLATIAGKGAEIIYGPGAAKIVVAGEVDPLLPDAPNVVRFVARSGPSLAEEGNGITTVTNQSTGPGSIDERGETVTLVVEVEAEGQDELDAVAAADAQRYFAGGGVRFTGNVLLNPRHGDRDVVGLVKPRLDLTGDFAVTEWRYPLQRIIADNSVLMPITCEQRVVLS